MEMDPVTVQEQTATFKEEASTYSVNIAAPRDSTFTDGYSDNVPLGQFLARPVLINSDTWTTNFNASTDFKTFDPWTLWQSDARVKAKLQNFAYGSWDLKLRFVVNGSPFQYGRNMIVYVPYGDVQQNTSTARNQTAMAMENWGTAGNGTSDGGHEDMFRHFSTYPHAFLNPSSNQVIEMTLPFIWHNNYISINGTTIDSKESLGNILMFDINPLRIANVNAPQIVRYNVYAWAENLKLTMPTEFTPTGSFGSSLCDCVEREKKREETPWLLSEYDFVATSDEYADGPVSAMSSAIAAAAGNLVNAPVIGPFARATEIGAGAIGNIASLFGFSAPPMVQNPDRFVARNHGRLANTSGEDSCYSLALDPKQEITVDPRTVGVHPSDEMSISSIVTREQWLARADWRGQFGQFSTAGTNEILFASLVSPNQQHHSTIGATRCHMDTPAGHVANMFEFWKGSITYRVEVICTPYHSGRLKLQFDPFVKNSALTPSDAFTNDVNARYTTIMDLSEETSTEFTIDYNSRYPWLRCLQDPSAANQYAPSSVNESTFDLVTAFDDKIHMGIFVISVVNDLVAPIETNAPADATHAPVQINVYVKCGDDLQFAQPNEVSTSWSVAKFVPTSADVESFFQATSDTMEHTIIGQDVDDHNSLVFFGESVSSIRSLIKRYSLVFTGDYNNDARNNNFEMVTRYVPHLPGQVTGGKARRNSFLTYMSPCYLLGRGSTRYKFTYYDKGAAPNGVSNSYQWFERQGLRSPLGTVGHTVQDTVTMSSAALDSAIPHGYQGAAFTDNAIQSTLEVQLPFYSNTRYFLTSHFMNVNDDSNESLLPNPAMTQILAGRHVYTGVDAHANVMQQWFAAGDDFSLHFFLGVPGTFTATSAEFEATSLNTVSLISDGHPTAASVLEYPFHVSPAGKPISWNYSFVDYYSMKAIIENTGALFPIDVAAWKYFVDTDERKILSVFWVLDQLGAQLEDAWRGIIALYFPTAISGDYPHWETSFINYADVQKELSKHDITSGNWEAVASAYGYPSGQRLDNPLPIAMVVGYFRTYNPSWNDKLEDYFRSRYRYARSMRSLVPTLYETNDPVSWPTVEMDQNEFFSVINGVSSSITLAVWNTFLSPLKKYTLAFLKYIFSNTYHTGKTIPYWNEAINNAFLVLYPFQ